MADKKEAVIAEEKFKITPEMDTEFTNGLGDDEEEEGKEDG